MGEWLSPHLVGLRKAGESALNLYLLLCCALDPDYRGREECYACQRRRVCDTLCQSAIRLWRAQQHRPRKQAMVALNQGHPLEIHIVAKHPVVTHARNSQLICPICGGTIIKRQANLGYRQCRSCHRDFKLKAAALIEVVLE